MDAHELDDPGGVQRGKTVDRTSGRSRGEAEAELRVLLTGSDEFVGVDLDAGGDPGQHAGPPPHGRFGVLGAAVERGRVGDQALDPVDLVEGVDHDTAHPDRQGRGQLLGRLVVAVQDQPLGRYTGGQGYVEFAPRGHIEAHALLVDEPRHGHAQERLGGVGHPVAPGRDRLAAGGTQMRLVVDEQWRAVGLGQLPDVAAADGQPSVSADGRSRRQEVEVHRTGGDRHRHIASGADTPRRPRPMASPTRAPSTSQRRAWASDGSTSSARIGQSW